MINNRSKLIAIITGIFSIFICISYLILITFLDFRALLNNYLTNYSGEMEVISTFLDFFH